MKKNEKFEDSAAPLKADAAPSQPVEKLWAAHGVEDVYFQREAQVTWWTILGGIAVGAVLTRLESLPAAFNAGQWYVLLYLVATLVVIINSWAQTVWGSLVLRWPISIPLAVLTFMGGIALSVAGLNISKPALWYAAISMVLLTAVLHQLTFSKMNARENLPNELVKRAQKGVRIYYFLCGFTIASSILLALVSSRTLQIIWGIFALAGSIMALTWQHIGMTEEKRMMGIP